MLLPALQQARERAQASKCVSNLKQLANVGILYLGDNVNFWPSPNAGQNPTSYYGSFDYTTGNFKRAVAGWLQRLTYTKYLPSFASLSVTAKGRPSWISCPSMQISRNPDIDDSLAAFDIQMYASIYNNGTSYDQCWGMPFNDPGFQIGRRGGTSSKIQDENVPMNKRVWFADGKDYKTGLQSHSLYSAHDSSAGGKSWRSRINMVHNERANIAGWDGSVSTVSILGATDYYQCMTGGGTGHVVHYASALMNYTTPDIDCADKGGPGQMALYEE